MVPVDIASVAVQVKVPSLDRKLFVFNHPLSVKYMTVPEAISLKAIKPTSSGLSKLKPIMAMSPAPKEL